MVLAECLSYSNQNPFLIRLQVTLRNDSPYHNIDLDPIGNGLSNFQ